MSGWLLLGLVPFELVLWEAPLGLLAPGIRTEERPYRPAALDSQTFFFFFFAVPRGFVFLIHAVLRARTTGMTPRPTLGLLTGLG